jgi:hypothetical protein
MNVIFLTIAVITDVEKRGIYNDLMRKFRDSGHQVYIVTPSERRLGHSTCLVESHGVHILNVKTLNIQKTNVLEKGIGTLLIERQFKAAIKKYLGDVRFDLITYSTPPITFTNVVKYLKQSNPQAVSYLQLKDIFPQNAVDIGLFGEKSLFHWYFRRKEVELYRNSDYIGCMSPANVEFLLKHNPGIEADKVEVAPNATQLVEHAYAPRQQEMERRLVRTKYNLPTDGTIFIYGGNLGKPQGIDYLLQCLNANKCRQDCFFLIIGSGTDYHKVEDWIAKQSAEHLSVRLMCELSKEDYTMLVRACDVGLIFLDHRFTIPNFPSRLLPYLEQKMPVICATDPCTDIGKIAEANGFGFWCESVRPEDFTRLVDKMLAADRKQMGERGYQFLKDHYLVEHTYNVIMQHFHV